MWNVYYIILKINMRKWQEKHQEAPKTDQRKAYSSVVICLVSNCTRFALQDLHRT